MLTNMLSKGKKKGSIDVTIVNENNKIKIMVADNGVGLPKNFDIENIDSLGLQIVAALVGQLNGEIFFNKTNGTKIIITFIH